MDSTIIIDLAEFVEDVKVQMFCNIIIYRALHTNGSQTSALFICWLDVKCYPLKRQSQQSQLITSSAETLKKSLGQTV